MNDSSNAHRRGSHSGNTPLVGLSSRVVLLGLVLLLPSCRNVFEIGLGDKVDIDPPNVAITSHSDGQYLRGSTSFSGTLSDDSVISSVLLSTDRGVSFAEIETFDQEAGTWSHTVDTLPFEDGEYEVRVRVVDQSGKQADAKALLFFDNTPPTVLVRTPQGIASAQFNLLINISGDAYDTYGITRVELGLLDESGSAVPLRRTAEAYSTARSAGDATLEDVADGTNSWSYPFDSSLYTDGRVDFSVRVRATDRAGNVSSRVFHGDAVRAAVGRTPTINELYAAIKSGSRIGSADVSALAREQLTIQINQDLDLPGIEFNMPTSESPLLGQNPRASGSATDDDGIDTGSIEILIDGDPSADTGWTAVSEVNGAGARVNWEHDLSALSQGHHTLAVRVRDIEGRANRTANLDFVIDYGPPTLSIGAPEPGTYHNGNVVVSGIVEDGATIDEVEVSVDGGTSYHAIPTTQLVAPGAAGAPGRWEWSYTYDLIAPGATRNGTQVFRVRAVDPAGEVATESVQVTIDVAAPTLAFLDPGSGSAINGLTLFQGTTDDRSPLTELALYDVAFASVTSDLAPVARISGDINTFSNDSGGNASTEYRWYKTIDTTAYQVVGQPPVSRVFTIVARDEAGNVGYTELPVSVDQSTDFPTIRFDNADPTASRSENVFSAEAELIGRIEDDDGINPAAVAYRIDDSDWLPLSVTTQGRAANWSFTAPNDEGAHTLQLRADDVYGTRTESAVLAFNTDTGAPTVALSRLRTATGTTDLTTGIQGAFVDGAFYLSGSATDGVSVDSVSVNLNEETDPVTGGLRYIPIESLVTTASDATTGAATAVTWTDFEISGDLFLTGAWPNDGTLALQIRTVDGSGKSGATNVAITLDRQKPIVTIAGLNPVAVAADGSNPAVVNGTVAISGSASDTNPVRRVYAWTGLSGDVPPSALADWQTLSGTNTWTRAIDTRDLADGTYELHVLAVDAAGNESDEASIPFTVDQSTDVPIVRFENVATSVAENLFTNSDVIRGTATDDDGVGSIEVDMGAGWTSAPVTSAGTGRSVAFSIDLSGVAERPEAHTIRVRASDSDPDLLGPSVALSVEGQFYLDNQAPVLTETTVATADRRTSSAPVVFGGSATDSNTLAALTLSVNGGSATSITPAAGGNWTYTFPNTTDGEFDLEFTATDLAGRTATVARAVLIDATRPTTPVIDAFAGPYQVTELVASGSASDVGSGLQVVEYSLDGSTWASATGTGSWFRTIDISALSEGAATLSVRARDRAGNNSVVATRSFTVDRANPILTVDAAYDGTPYRKMAFAVNGTISDSLGLNSTPVTVVATGPSGVVDLTSSTLSYTAADGTWTRTIPVSQGDGSYSVTITATDAVGRSTTATRVVVVDTTGPSVSLGNLSDGQSLGTETFAVTGTASDGVGSGVSLVQYDLNGGGWTDATGTASWTIPLTLSEGPGQSLSVRSTDHAGNQGSATTISFGVDYGPPVLAETASGITGTLIVYRGADVPLGGSVTDGNGVASAVVEYSKNGGSAVELLNDTTDDGTWGTTLPVSFGDGAYEVTIAATDGFGKVSSIARNIVFDTSPPDLTIVEPGAGELVEGNAYTIRGQVTDNGGRGVTSLAYSTDNTTWTPIGLSGLNWSESGLNFSTGGEGPRTLWVKASDGVNGDALQTVSFNYDIAPPTLTETTVNTDAQQVSSTAVSFGGNATDSNAFSSLTVSVNGGASVAVDVDADGVDNIAGNSDDGSWSYSHPSTNNGTFELRFTATDVAGRTTTVTRNVLIDKAAPTAPTINAFSGSYQVDDLVASGTAVDSGTGGSGVQLVQYSMDNTTWSPATGTGSWFQTVDISSLPEGTNTLYVRATDRAGNVSASGSRSFTVDRANPTVVVDAEYDGTQYRNEAFTIGGNVSDTLLLGATPVAVSAAGPTGAVDLSASTLAYDADGADNTAGTADDGAWSRQIPIGQDGSYTVTITATDSVGRTTTATRVVVIDTTPPTLANINLNANDLVSTVSFTVTGTATDESGSGVATVQYRLNGGTPAEATGTSSWTIPLTGLTDGMGQTLELWTTDRAGNTSETTTPISLTFDVDLASPVLTEEASGITDASTVYRNTDVSLGGAVTDGNAVTSVEVAYRKNGGTSQTLLNDTTDDDAWSTILSTSLGDGAYEVTITATDEVGKTTTITRNIVIDTASPDLTISSPAPGELVDTNAYTIRGQVTDNGGKGVTSLAYSKTGAFAGEEIAITLSGLNWSVSGIDFTTGGQGPKTLWVRASDGLNTDTIASVSFNYDDAAPVLTETTVNSESQEISRLAVAFGGKASDTNALAKLEVSVNDGAPAAIVVDANGADNIAGNTDDNSWGYEQPNTADGEFTVVFTAEDTAGRTTSVTRSVLIDTEAPAAPTIAAFADAYQVDSLVASGTAADGGSGLGAGAVEYSFDGAGWTAASGTEGWFKTIGISALAQGEHTLFVRATDRAGNITGVHPGGGGVVEQVASRTFVVDRENPTVVVDAGYDGTQYRNAAFTIGGTVSDTLLLGSSPIAVSAVGPTGAVDLSGNPLVYDADGADNTVGTADDGAWSQEIPIGQGNGSYTVTVVGTDAVGRTTTATRVVVIDTQAPTFTINNVALDGSTQVNATEYTVTGNVADTSSGVASLEYSLDYAGDPATATWNTATGTSSWSAQLSGLTNTMAQTFAVRATDAAGNVQTVDSRTFKVDLAAPTIANIVFGVGEVSVYAGNTYANGNYSFSFDAGDTHNLASYTVQRDGVAITGHSATAVSGQTQTITVNETVGGVGLADGTYEYTITVSDVVGKQTTQTLSVNVDSTFPDLEITNLSPTVAEGATTKVNGTVQASVAAGDTGGLVGVKWWVVDDALGTVPTSYDSAGGTLFGASPYTVQLDTTDTGVFTEDAGHTIYVIARDRALNDRIIDTSFVVDQDSDLPTVVFTDLDDAITSGTALNTALDAGNQDNLLELNARVRGTVEDDDQIDASTIKIALNTVSPTDTDFVSVTSAGSNGASVTFSHTLGLDDGVHFFYLRFSDDPTVKLGASPTAKTTTAGPIYFVVDTQNPTVGFSTPAGNSYQTNTFTAGGPASDVSGINAVDVSINGGVTYAAAGYDSGAEQWSKSIDVSALPDGVVSIDVRATDRFGKTSTVNRQVTIDRNAPTVSIVEPLAGTVNGEVLIRGTTTDNFEIDATYWWIGAQGATPPDVTTSLGSWTPFAGRYSWDYTWNTASGSYPTGNYTVHVVARDSAGNVSATNIDTVTVAVDQTTDKPTIELTSISATGTASTNLLPGSLQISGSVGDDDAIDASTLQIRVETLDATSVEQFTWTDVCVPPTSDAGFGTWSHTFSSVDGTDLADDQYRLYVRVADINDADPVTGNPTWGTNTSTTIGPIEFAVDLANPTLLVTAPASGSYVNQSTVTITGDASDTSGISSVEVSLDGGQPATDTSGTNPAFTTWSYVYDASGVADGQVSYQVTATDAYGKVSTVNRTFILDRTAPGATFIQPSAGDTVNGAMVVRGSASDDYSVQKVSYALVAESGGVYTAPTYPADYTALPGTFSWDFAVDTSLRPNGNHRVYIVTEDSSGNTSAASPTTRDVVFDQTANLPVVAITNASAVSGTPTLFASGSIVGTITDDDGVDISSIEISTDGGATWGPVTNPPSSGGVSVNFSHNIDGNGSTITAIPDSDGAYTVKVRAFDVGESAYSVAPVSAESAAAYVAVDRQPPTISLSTIDIVDPYGGTARSGLTFASGMLINDDFTLNGPVSDPSVVVAVRVTVNGTTEYTPALTGDTTTGATWAQVVPVTRAPASDGPMTIEVEAEDTWGRVTTQTYNVVIDTSEPTVNFTAPDFSSPVNGAVELKGTNSDANSITALALELGKNATPLTNAGTLLSWSTTVDSSDYADSTDGTETGVGTNVWDVPFVVTVTDSAGNITGNGLGLTQTLQIAPDTDRPVVTITGPADTTSVATEFVFQGTVTDDDSPPLRVALSADPGLDGTFEVDLGEITNITGGSWVKIVDTTDTAVFTAAPTGDIRLRAIPYDAAGVEGVADIHTVFVDTSAPTVTIDSPTPGAVVAGAVTITGSFADDQALADSQMRVSLDGGTTYQAITAVGGTVAADVGNPVAGQYLYTFSIPVATTTAVAGGNGYLDVSVRVTDDTYKQSTGFLNLSVDNDRPAVSINDDGAMDFVSSGGNVIYTFNGNATDGGSYVVSGEATDTGTVYGVERVDVYFVKNNTFISVRNAGTTLAESTAQVADQTGTLQTIPYRVPTARTVPDDGILEDEYVISIDARLERGVNDTDPEFGDQDDFQESIRSAGGADEWFVEFDTTVLPDGPMDMYLLVYDEAGNVSYRVADVQAANYPPSISSVEINATAPDPTSRQAKVAATTSVTMNIGAQDVADPFGNEGIDTDTFRLTVANKYAVADGLLGDEDDTFVPFFYSSPTYSAESGYTAPVTYSTSPATGSVTPASASITIDMTAGFIAGNWYRFVAQALDRDGNIASYDYYAWVTDGDTMRPTATIDVFSQDSVAGLLGHIESETQSGNDTVGNEDPDLSGSVRVTGTAWDDTAVVSISLEATVTPESLVDGNTTWETIATLTGASVEQVSGDVLGGYTYEWSYDWDTTGLVTLTGFGGAAQEDITIRAVANDSVGGSAAPPMVQVDVVPYITDIETTFDGLLLSNVRRTALGKYPVTVGSTITIHGYNLPGQVAGSVTVGGSPLNPLAGSTSTMIEVNLGAIETSGGLVVTTNGAESINNTNGDDAHNHEPTTYNPNLYDDREIVFWRRSSVPGTTNIVDPAMNPTWDRTEFDWMYTKAGTQLYLSRGATPTETLLTNGTALRGGDFLYNEDGRLMFIFNHNARWSTYNTTYSFTGSVQYGLVPDITTYAMTESDVAYNWSNSDSLPKLGVGNVNFGYLASGQDPGTLEAGMAYPYSAEDLNRYDNLVLRSVGDGNPASDAINRVYVAYFDTGADESRSIVFYGFQIGTTAASVTATSNPYQSEAAVVDVSLNGWFANIDKHYDTDSLVALAGTQKSNGTGIATPRGRQEVTTAQSEDDSRYFDLGIHVVDATTHYGYIAYFDESADGGLKLTANEGLYAADPTGTPTAWSTAQMVDSDGGSYVAMAVDGAGGIHLAYQSRGGSLKYAYATYSAATGQFTVSTPIVVDAMLGAGTFNSIDVRDFGTSDYRPVITTFSNAFLGTVGPLRMSYPANAMNGGTFGAGASASTGAYTGNWETVVIPASSAPQSTSTFTFTNATGQPHIGYRANTLEEATYLGF